MENQNFSYSSKIKEFAKKLGNYTLIIGMLVVGFFIGQLSTELFKRNEVSTPPSVRNLDEISIAINESNDILIIDRKDGTYEMFSDSVGMTIFRMYAGRIKNSVSTNNE
jgi:hypothetical protein